eukprot:c16274_g1_i2 orf=459-713(+)
MGGGFYLQLQAPLVSCTTPRRCACVEHIRTCYNICDIYVPVPLPKKRAFAHSEFIMIEGNLYFVHCQGTFKKHPRAFKKGQEIA